MGMREDFERYGNAFDWWSYTETRKAWGHLMERWDANPTGKLVQRRGLTKDGLPTLWFGIGLPDGSMVTEGDGDDGFVNMSRPCPPFCNGDG